MPKFNESDAMGRAGVHEVALLISEMKWIFREQQVSDTGIDGQIEPCDENGNASGKLIGCQVKSGPSYFREETDSGFIYRGDSEHLAYWLSHSLPVIVILRNDESGNCYWQLCESGRQGLRKIQDSGTDPTLQVLACTTRERHSDRRRGSAPVRGFAGNAIQAVGLRERIHPTRSFLPTLCPFLAIGTGNPCGEVLDREFWHLREVHPSDETRNHHLGLSPLYFIARR